MLIVMRPTWEGIALGVVAQALEGLARMIVLVAAHPAPRTPHRQSDRQVMEAEAGAHQARQQGELRRRSVAEAVVDRLEVVDVDDAQHMVQAASAVAPVSTIQFRLGRMGVGRRQFASALRKLSSKDLRFQQASEVSRSE